MDGYERHTTNESILIRARRPTKQIEGNRPEALFGKLFDEFVLPNVGLDHPLFHVDPSQSATLEEIMKRQVNKTLMQRYTLVSTV